MNVRNMEFRKIAALGPLRALALTSVVFSVIIPCNARADGIRTTLGVERPGLRNPERGWRFEVRVGLEAGEKPPARDNWPFPRYAYDGVTVSQAYCYLTKYCESEIAQSKIDALQSDFDRARRDGVKFLLRFAYETNMSRKEGPSLSRILSHIAQLKGVINRNADVLYCLQIGWVGAWGEFHASRSGIENDPDQVAQVVAATLDMMPTNRFMMMRYMRFHEQAAQRLGECVEKRIGFFNDGTLAGFIEGGTFIEFPEKMEKIFWGDLLWGKYGERGNPQYDKVARLGLHLPVDGELYWTKAGISAQWETGMSAILRLHEHHYTTFSVVHGNADFDNAIGPGAIDSWKVTPVTPEMLSAYKIDFDPSYFSGVPYRTAYDFIRDHLGYRLVAAGFQIGGGLARVKVHNYGFAAPVNPRFVYLAILGNDGNVRTFRTAVDSRCFAAGKDAVVTGPVPDLSAGERLALCLPDEMLPDRPEFSVRFAGGVDVVEKDGLVLNVLKGCKE